MNKKCNGCKRTLGEESFKRKDKIHARCNDCSLNSSVKKNFCESCGIRASFNIPNLTWGRFCSSHKEIGMINVLDPKCKKEGCYKRPSYNYKGETTKLFCKDHKEIGMVNVNDKTCEKEDCNKRPVYNYKGETKGMYCFTHKLEGMIDVKNKTCEKENCSKQPYFNYEGETKGLFCKEHCEVNMINVIEKRKCEVEGCKKQPTYNYKGEKQPLFCKDHKEENMINIKDIKCSYEGCSKIPNFNYEWETKGKYCKEHKEDNMVDIKHKKCFIKGCKIQPTFNFEGEIKGKYCEKHKEPGMVNVKDRNRICEKEGCKTRAHFGYCGQSTSHCAQHKLDYMINNPKRICVGSDDEECKEVAIYGKSEPLHCEGHSLQDEICWLVNKCNNCGRDKELLNKDKLCGICCDRPFYEESKRINKLKETIMVKYLRKHINGNEILADRIIDSTCNLYRPDILYDCGTHIVVVECDENQHKNYPWESCSLNKSLEHMEEKRMYEIMIAYGLPAIFLRWNPDTFKVNGVINKKYNNDKRLEMLVKWVKYCFKMEVSLGVIHKKLFYDEYKEDDLSFKKIDETELI
jgi:hypothetical protein